MKSHYHRGFDPKYPKPFGESDCESEVRQFGRESYERWYFKETTFNDRVLDEDVYLIVGRRGAGKTALSNFFAFQGRIGNASTIDVDELSAFQDLLADFVQETSPRREIVIPALAKVWEYIFWSILFCHYKQYDPAIKAAYSLGTQENRVMSKFVRTLLEVLYKRFMSDDIKLLSHIDKFFEEEAIKKAKIAVKKVAPRRPVIIAFDTLENYSISDDYMMFAVSSLIQFASNFNPEYSRNGIYIKVFMMDEVFPELQAKYILNPLKSIKNELYLHWRPKDLMRMICWRLSNYWENTGRKPSELKYSSEIDWDDYGDVLENYWIPHFGKNLKNGCEIEEETFPYLLRHTQLRPRQLIYLCNSIAERAVMSNNFPKFSERDLIDGIKSVEVKLAAEVLNAYESVYPEASKIVNSLSGMPPIFTGKDLDLRAKQTSSYWRRGDYSLDAFRQLVAKIGIVGKVRQKSSTSNIVEADFEYSRTDNLTLLTNDECVIHPMFYRKLDVNLKDRNICVYPFPDKKEFDGIFTR